MPVIFRGICEWLCVGVEYIWELWPIGLAPLTETCKPTMFGRQKINWTSLRGEFRHGRQFTVR